MVFFFGKASKDGYQVMTGQHQDAQ